MKTIYRIAKTELSLLFYSPIAWLALIIFILQSGLVFTDSLSGWLRIQESEGNIRPTLFGGLTALIFNFQEEGLYPVIQATLFLYIPLLTMGLMSRELSSGTIKLLMSSPVKISQIILGKFCAMLFYGILFILIIFLFILTGNIAIKSMDITLTLSGLISTYLLICAYSAIGLFMSSLTSYQVVAAIGTLAALIGFNYLGKIGQNLAFVQSITYFLSLGNQTKNLNHGLISSADVFYFVIITGLFLSLTIMRLNDGRSLKSKLFKAFRYISLIAVFLILGYLSTRPAFIYYYDMTENKNQTLSSNSQNVLKQIKSPLKVTAYANLLGDHAFIGLPENRNKDRRFWEPYTRFMPDMEFSYVYYYDTSKHFLFKMKENSGLNIDQLAKKYAESYGYSLSMFLTPSEIRKQLDIEPEGHRFVREIESGDKKTFLRAFDDPNYDGQPSEHEITASFARLVTNPPKILFLKGHYERDINKEDADQYGTLTIEPGFRSSLMNQGFDIDTISLKRQDIIFEKNVLVIADPKIVFEETELAKISQFIEEGGNMLIAGDTGTQKVLNPLLKKLGVQLSDGFLVQESKDFGPDRIQAIFADSLSSIFDREKLRIHGSDSLDKVIMNGAVGLEYKDSGNFKITPILCTDSNHTWNKTSNKFRNTGQLTFNPLEGDSRKSAQLGLALTRNIAGKQQRIIITGDADFMSNAYWADWIGNKEGILGIFKWLNYGAFPIDTDPVKPIDIDIRIGKRELTPIKIFFLFVLPISLLICGSVLLLRRQKR